ncbi:cytochrome c oxidase subunit I [Aliifodinibius sp. S!AR15-10]|uniref:cytochrome c oxidase subunit I n=1 Tax=Aliifodinibius sp. S!AR15-10 TaxID=2950437 RepID=UPI00285657B0|nr:cytochrome c oxidase subunit I [Aliifodinibius sp. S!AR15-10]MDR8390014.1 cytochrome c oxidase subunit I [Aliifodinibius sp. S!AR15-10]
MADVGEKPSFKTLQVKRYIPVEYLKDNYLNAEKGIWSWLNTRDHKRIGVLFLISITIFFLFAGLVALLIRAELWTPVKTIVEADIYNQLFTVHGTIMIFLFLVPSVPTVLGNFFLPIQLGAKDVAFPRLNLASWYLLMTGALLSIYVLFAGGIDTGWTFYTPYSSSTGGAVTAMTFGVFIIGFSSIFTGVNFITTIHKMRAPGLTWSKLPLFCWALYATSILQILATPVLAITIALVGMERILGIGIFDPALGGDPVLYQHFFWFYSHPAVYIMIVPGFGIVSEVVSTFSKKTIFGYWAIALSSLAIAFISFLVWGHHMFTSGQASLASTIFSFLTFLVGIPTGIKMFNWLATMHKGSIKLDTPLLYILGFFFLFTVGGLTGIVLATIALDIHLHDTYYVVAHFHFVMVGGMVMAFLGGLHYWWPKMFGVMYNETLAKIACFLIFVGFNVTFLPQFVMGAQGMPRRYYNYVEQFTAYHQVSTVGSFILGIGFLMVVYYLIRSIYKGKNAGANPWGSRALEWQIPSPAPPHNFEYTPVIVHGPYDYHKPMEDFQLGLAKTTNGEKTAEPVSEE